MAPQSLTSRMTDQIVALGATPLLKAHGYRKSGRSFHVRAGEVLKVVAFQSSMWNMPDSARFTINLNVALPFFHEAFMGQPFPGNPASAVPIVGKRIGHLMPVRRDYWWELTPSSDVAQIASDVNQALSLYGIPFLDAEADVGKQIARLEAGQGLLGVPSSRQLSHAILLCYRGDHPRAAAVLRKLATENTHPGFGETIERIAGRLGLKEEL